MIDFLVFLTYRFSLRFCLAVLTEESAFACGVSTVDITAMSADTADF